MLLFIWIARKVLFSKEEEINFIAHIHIPSVWWKKSLPILLAVIFPGVISTFVTLFFYSWLFGLWQRNSYMVSPRQCSALINLMWGHHTPCIPQLQPTALAREQEKLSGVCFSLFFPWEGLSSAAVQGWGDFGSRKGMEEPRMRMNQFPGKVRKMLQHFPAFRL